MVCCGLIGAPLLAYFSDLLGYLSIATCFSNASEPREETASVWDVAKGNDKNTHETHYVSKSICKDVTETAYTHILFSIYIQGRISTPFTRGLASHTPRNRNIQSSFR